ncbi:hypothetical protein E4U42_003593 [Claviceps africana]|uniref:Uncharacterized protein n=1 Tax=Claviceps africana TaxID=83212 RepID=A0A8K0J8Y8_9HYPO|nr:hypothetical protein E4U42_003593 [Claviceps africana]
MTPSSPLSASLSKTAWLDDDKSINHDEQNTSPLSECLARLQRFCRHVRRRLCPSRRPRGRIVWFDRQMPWMESPARALAEMERLSYTSRDGTHQPRGLRRLLRARSASDERYLVVVSPHDHIFLPVPPEEAPRRSRQETLWNGVARKRRPSVAAEGETSDSDDWYYGSFPPVEQRAPTLPGLEGREKPTPVVVLHERIVPGPSLAARGFSFHAGARASGSSSCGKNDDGIYHGGFDRAPNRGTLAGRAARCVDSVTGRFSRFIMRLSGRMSSCDAPGSPTASLD